MSSPNPHILYVDDNKDSCELAAVMFNCLDLDCVLIPAGSAEEALLLIEVEPFDLYIFDYRLPGISGVELCRHIRQYDSDTPIMFFYRFGASCRTNRSDSSGRDRISG
jgi:CheY-like chemotaxis protein